MSADGCEPVAWKGQAFPFLMHHPNQFHKTENYGTARQSGSHGSAKATPSAQPAGSDAVAPAGTGTWNGPAPRGYMRDGVNMAAAVPEVEAKAMQQPNSVLLSNGTTMPMIGLGTAKLPGPEVVREALKLGYRHIDTADCYGSHKAVGTAVSEWIAAGEGTRDQLFIVTKLWQSDYRPARVRPAVERMLSELNCGYIDLLLMHWPEASDPDAPSSDWWNTITIDNTVTINDTWQELEKLVDAGLVKSIGVSNFSLKQVEALLASARVKPVCNQVELHAQLPQRKLVGVCFRKGVQCVAYSPLGGAGHQVPNTLMSHPVVQQIAQETGKSAAQVLLRWNMQRGVPVLPKASSVQHLKDNIEGAFEWMLNVKHKNMLDDLEDGTRFINPAWKTWDDPEEGGAAKPSLVFK